ncbi:hypothetical protein [Holdemanella porci]|uniref:hypothetical protein n=1 Tax=Holdemanella porci TaxID=2652276 RepID=UPI003F8E49B6
MAKPYNHRRAENEYVKWKQKDEKFMIMNGMSKEKVKIMRDFDRKQFNSNRRYEEKIDFDSEKIISKAQQSEVLSLNDSSSLEDFINSISSIAFAEALKELGFEVQLIVFLMYRGFNAKEVSRITGIPEWTISRRLSKLERSYYRKKSRE